ncbi:hypothetical protein JTE90_007375 [Oedothorax gibbosus]|uniref:EamA domain-containing protein n=1 Tax=Oedothorax gibbosus TaxID=931172 RepID=A0AAV6U6S9_9ARAC|nr:hypothetical protein JTE90_007375 [Oedothorax gibbosus]
MAAEKTLSVCETLLENLNYGNSNKPVYSYTPICQNALLWVRVASLAAMLLLNGLMWTLFTKALRRSPAALAPSLVNTAANFLCTAVFGGVLFEESLPPLWWGGAALVVLGLALLLRTPKEE